MSVPSDLRYTKDHEWVRVDGDEATVGITAYAADQLGDIVFVELPDVGRTLDQSATFGVVESVKAVSDLFAPVGGEVVATNDELTGRPELVNSDPYGDGWMIRVRVADPAQVDGLLDAGRLRRPHRGGLIDPRCPTDRIPPATASGCSRPSAPARSTSSSPTSRRPSAPRASTSRRPSPSSSSPPG